MSNNVWSIGSQTLNGELGRIYAVGELDIRNVKAEKLNSIGEMSINNSYIKKVRVVGEVNAADSNFKDVKITGEANITGVSKAESFVINGELNAEYLECKILRNSNKSMRKKRLPTIVNFSGSYKAETFENLHPFNLDCDFNFSNIISASDFKYKNILECERFYAFSEVDIEGINADFIYLKPDSQSKIQSIVGTKIIISDRWKGDKEFENLPKSVSTSYYLKNAQTNASKIRVPKIEGDTIYINNVKADIIRGIDVVIGDNCIIDRVEYRSNIKVSKKAIVNEVHKDE